MEHTTEDIIVSRFTENKVFCLNSCILLFSPSKRDSLCDQNMYPGDENYFFVVFYLWMIEYNYQ